MEGLGRHYSNAEKQVVSGHCLFTGVYAVLGQRCPLAAQLYCQKSVCQQEGIAFMSKVDLAIQQISEFEAVAGTHTHVLIDSWHHCQSVRKAASKRGWEVSGALKSNRAMRLITEDGSREWLKLSEYAKSLTREDWQEIRWPSEQGGQTVYGHQIITWVRKLGPILLLITCHNLDYPLKSIRYWGSNRLDLDAQPLVEILSIRWDVETFFEYDKDLLGSDHYQLMTAQRVLRFWTLTACLITFLEEQRGASKEACGDVRRDLQLDHRRTVLLWLGNRLTTGQSVDQILSQLAL